MVTKVTFGNLVGGPFILPSTPPGSVPKVFIKLHECYGDYFKGKDQINAISSAGEPYIFEDDEEVIMLASVKGEPYE